MTSHNGFDGQNNKNKQSDQQQGSAANNKRTPLGSPKQNHTARPVGGSKKPPEPKGASKKAAPVDETVIFNENASKKFTGKIKKQDHTQMIPPVDDGSSRKISPVGKKSWFKPRDKKPNFVLSVVLTTIKMSFVALVLVAIIGVGSFMGLANAYLETTPPLDLEKIEDQQLTSKIYSPDGIQLAIYTGSENREWANIDEIPKELQSAIISVEDIRFYDHNGVDLRRLIGAFVSNLSSSKVEGGSTITQQLVKNKLLTNERSYKRKLQEASLAMELEKKYDKSQILEAYLNTIPLGGTVYGVKTAAYDYFGKNLSQLNLKEMICIASITQNPHQYNPRRATYGQGNLVGLINRMNIIAERMYWNGIITEEQYNQVRVPKEVYAIDYIDEDGKTQTKINPSYLETWKTEMQILDESPADEMYQYPHYVEYVIYQVQTFMLRQRGLEDTKANRQKMDLEMRSNGYEIYSNIDTQIQETVQNTLTEWSNYPKLANSEDSITRTKDSKGNVIETKQPQAAAVVVENETGYLKAIVGSRDEPTAKRTFNRAYMGQMMVGSSIKPITVYGPALDAGLSPATSIANVEVAIPGWISKTGYPETSKGELGPAPIRRAVVGSWNIVAARTLMEEVTVDKAYDYLQKLGVSPPKDPELIGGVGLALGAYPVTPIEMSGAYATLARGGEYKEPLSFSKVTDSEGNIIIDAEAEREQHEVYKGSTAWMITDMLTEAASVGTGKQANIPGMTTAGKTGTVMDHKGTFFAGYTPYYTSALWVGQDNSKPLAGSYAGSTTAPLWKSYMAKIHEGKEDKSILPKSPEEYGLVKATICKWSNKLPNGSCSDTVTDWFAPGTVPTATCDVCYSGDFCSASGKRWVEGFCPPDTKVAGTLRNFPENSPYRASGGGSGYSNAPCDIHTEPYIPPAASSEDPHTPAPEHPIVVPPA